MPHALVGHELVTSILHLGRSPLMFFSSALLAQLAEQLTLNQRVQGSSPWRRTETEAVPYWRQDGTASFMFASCTPILRSPEARDCPVTSRRQSQDTARSNTLLPQRFRLIQSSTNTALTTPVEGTPLNPTCRAQSFRFIAKRRAHMPDSRCNILPEVMTYRTCRKSLMRT